MHSYKLSCTSFDLQYMQLLSKEIVHNIMFQVQFCSPLTEDAKYKKKYPSAVKTTFLATIDTIFKDAKNN